MSGRRARVLVLGYIVRGPLGGLVWHHLQYVLGLLQLGYDAYFLEDSEEYPACYNPQSNSLDTDCSYGLTFCENAFAETAAAGRWAYFDWHTNQWRGRCAAEAPELIRSADIVVNVSGVNPLRGDLANVPVRILVDTDPVFTQIRHLEDAKARDLAEQHTAFFTFGENFGRAGCTIPDDGLPWHVTRQPVVRKCWTPHPGSEDARFTTVMQWDSYRERYYQGRAYGMKSRSFRDYMDFPRRTGVELEMALGSASAPRDGLRAAGWRLADPLEVTRTPRTYQDYLLGSKGEFSIAKHGYVVSNSGWFSERSAAYLASGRPVIAQDTGFSRFLPCGEGLFAFRDPQEAAAALLRVTTGYAAHCRKARQLAEECFDSDTVLSALLQGPSTCH